VLSTVLFEKLVGIEILAGNFRSQQMKVYIAYVFQIVQQIIPCRLIVAFEIIVCKPAAFPEQVQGTHSAEIDERITQIEKHRLNLLVFIVHFQNCQLK
jgi:hypothetical protein